MSLTSIFEAELQRQRAREAGLEVEQSGPLGHDGDARHLPEPNAQFRRRRRGV